LKTLLAAALLSGWGYGGFVSDPSYMNWVGALARISNHDYPQVVRRVLAGLRPGQQPSG